MAWITKEEKERQDSAAAHMGMGLAIVKIVFLIIPILVGKVLGLIIGLFLKLGIVGKVILTTLFTATIFVSSLFVIGTLEILPEEKTFINYALAGTVIAVCLAISLFIGIFWFWRKHYHVIKNIPIGEFSNIFTIALAIFMYGSIILLLIVWRGLKITDWDYLFYGIALASAVVFWLIKTRPYAGLTENVEEEAETETQE
jgi:hypothetical protein